MQPNSSLLRQVRRFCTLALGAFARGYSLDVVKEGGVQVLVERLSIDSSTSVRSLSAEILAHLLYNHKVNIPWCDQLLPRGYYGHLLRQTFMHDQYPLNGSHFMATEHSF